MKDFNILGNLLSPYNGIAIMGIISIWATTEFINLDFKYWLLGFATFCVFCAVGGDLLHHRVRNKYEKEKEVAIKKKNDNKSTK